MNENEFAKIGRIIDTAIKQYRDVRIKCGIPDDGWHSRTIERMAKPFIKGHFTLAIVGKVSSGKSTFINALLGCKDLLPTGHDQTTCGITYIEYGEKPEVTITFGDGHKSVIKNDIRGKVKQHVAIPAKYHNLPVNNIDDMIMGGFDFKKIWNVRQQLERETLCAPIDEKLLKEYVAQRKKKDIAIRVDMKFPFNEELKGWRVIDTPGIGAIGGIETRTKQLLATQKEDGSREVDAIIFLQKGSETLDQTDTKQFMIEQLQSMTESDKHRLFYVLTYGATSEFLNHKDSKIDFIKQNYGDKIKSLTYADSLLYTFISDLQKSDVDLKLYDDFAKPDDWSGDEWDAVLGVLDMAKRHLKRNGETFNHDTMYRLINDWAHFEELKKEINQFAKSEKEKTLRSFLNLIATDYYGFVQKLDKDKNLVDGDLGTINSEIKKVELKKKEYNVLAQKADASIRIDSINNKFAFINDELKKFESLQSVSSVRTAITNLFDAVQSKEKDIFQEIARNFSSFFKDYDSNDIILESLDFASLEIEATNMSQESYVIEPSRTITHTSDPDEIIPAKYGTRTNNNEKLRNFKALAIKRVREQRDTFLPQLKDKMENMRTQIFSELDKKINEEIRNLESLKSQLGRKQEFKAENDAFISTSHKAAKELIKLAEGYGFKF